MIRFQLIFSVLVSLSLSACHPASPRVSTDVASHNPERRKELPLVLVITPVGSTPMTLLRALRSELHRDFDVHTLEISEETGTNELSRQLPQLAPRVVVVVDNPTVALYRDWASSTATPPPAIIVMASFAQQLHLSVPNATGIAFEPPAVTVLSDLRRLLRMPIRRAGVIYREGFEDFIAREQKRLSPEKIELVAVSVPRSPTARNLNRALREIATRNVEALWISNDNVLLSPTLLSQAWLPHARQVNIPIIVGVPSLITNRPHFGTYAAVADLEGLGLQAADLVYTLEELNWNAKATPIQPPLSIKTYVDLTQARSLGLAPEDDQLIDVLVGEAL